MQSGQRLRPQEYGRWYGLRLHASSSCAADTGGEVLDGGQARGSRSVYAGSMAAHFECCWWCLSDLRQGYKSYGAETEADARVCAGVKVGFMPVDPFHRRSSDWDWGSNALSACAMSDRATVSMSEKKNVVACLETSLCGGRKIVGVLDFSLDGGCVQ